MLKKKKKENVVNMRGNEWQFLMERKCLEINKHMMKFPKLPP